LFLGKRGSFTVFIATLSSKGGFAMNRFEIKVAHVLLICLMVIVFGMPYGAQAAAENFDFFRLIRDPRGPNSDTPFAPNDDAIHLHNRDDLDRLNAYDWIDVKIQGSNDNFTPDGWRTSSCPPTGPCHPNDHIIIDIDRMIPMVKLHWSVEIKGFIPPEYESPNDVDNDPLNEPYNIPSERGFRPDQASVEGLLGGFSRRNEIKLPETALDIERNAEAYCRDPKIGMTFRVGDLPVSEIDVLKVPYNAYAADYDGDGYVDRDITRVVVFTRGSLNPGTFYSHPNDLHSFPVDPPAGYTEAFPRPVTTVDEDGNTVPITKPYQDANDNWIRCSDPTLEDRACTDEVCACAGEPIIPTQTAPARYEFPVGTNPNPRDVVYRFDYYYGFSDEDINRIHAGQPLPEDEPNNPLVPNRFSEPELEEDAAVDNESFSRSIVFRVTPLNGPNAGQPVLQRPVPLNWDLSERDDIRIVIGADALETMPQATFNNWKFRAYNAWVPSDYIPDLPNIIPSNPNADPPTAGQDFSCHNINEPHDDDIYDQFSCVSTMPIRSHETFQDKFVYAKEDRSIFHPTMDLKQRNPYLIDPAVLEVDPGIAPPLSISIKLKWRLGAWFMAYEDLKDLPSVKVLAAPGAVPLGQALMLRAQLTAFEGDQDDAYIAWCVDGVPNQGVAAGGRFMTEEDAVDSYPITTARDFRPATVPLDFNNNGKIDDAVEGMQELRPCCRMVTRVPDVDLDGDGMDDLWEMQHFPHLIQNPTDIGQLMRVDPFGDPDNDGYVADRFHKRDGYFYAQLILPLLGLLGYEKVEAFLERYDLLHYVPWLPHHHQLAAQNRDFIPDWYFGLTEGSGGNLTSGNSRFELIDNIRFIKGELHPQGQPQRPPINRDNPIRVVPDACAIIPSLAGGPGVIPESCHDIPENARADVIRIFRPGESGRLTNIEEYIYGTDPNNPDTDGDGYTDGEEIAGYGALDFIEKFRGEPGSKHSVRAISVGYSNQQLLEIDSSEQEFFVSKGGVMDVHISQTPEVISPTDAVRFEALPANTEIDPNGLVYEWELFGQSNDTDIGVFAPIDLGDDVSGKGKRVFTPTAEHIARVGINGTGLVTVRVIEETTGRSGYGEQYIYLGQPLRIEWIVVDTGQIREDGEPIRQIAACVQGVLDNTDKLNYVWVNGRERDMNASGIGDQHARYVFLAQRVHEFSPLSLGVRVYNEYTGELEASLLTSVDVNQGSSLNGEACLSAVQEVSVLDRARGALRSMFGRVKAALSSFVSIVQR
jgi:hypothetical protein